MTNKSIRSILGIGALLATLYTSACAPASSVYANSGAAAQDYVISGQPISVASNCRYGPYCNIGLVLLDDTGRKRAFGSESICDQKFTTTLEAVIEAEIADSDTEEISVGFDKNYEMKIITVEGTDYKLGK